MKATIGLFRTGGFIHRPISRMFHPHRFPKLLRKVGTQRLRQNTSQNNPQKLSISALITEFTPGSLYDFSTQNKLLQMISIISSRRDNEGEIIIFLPLPSRPHPALL